MSYIAYVPQRNPARAYVNAPNARGLGDWDEWDIAQGAFNLVSVGLFIFVGLVLWHALTKGAPAQKRRGAISKAKADLKAAQAMSRFY